MAKREKSPLERAARALCSLAGNPENATMDGKPLWQSYLPEARAVLQAIREPSRQMIEAAGNAEPHSEPGAWSYPDDLAAVHWQSMLDAALETESN